MLAELLGAWHEGTWDIFTHMATTRMLHTVGMGFISWYMSGEPPK